MKVIFIDNVESICILGSDGLAFDMDLALWARALEPRAVEQPQQTLDNVRVPEILQAC